MYIFEVIFCLFVLNSQPPSLCVFQSGVERSCCSECLRTGDQHAFLRSGVNEFRMHFLCAFLFVKMEDTCFAKANIKLPQPVTFLYS